MAKRKKDFPIKYMRNGLFSEEDFQEEGIKKKGKRHIKKSKSSVHEKTRAAGKKTK